MNRLIPLGLVALVAAGTTACSTPQAALDQANHAVKLTQQLKDELQRYQRNLEIAATRRLNVVQQDEAYIDEVRKRGALNDYFLSKSGFGERPAMQAQLLEATELRAKVVDEQDKVRQERADRFARLLKDLPSPSDKLGALQKAMAQLGAELSTSDRVAIVGGFLSEAKAIADKAGKQADKAADVPVPAAAASSATP